MTTLNFSGIEILAIAACVPKDIVNNNIFGIGLIPDKELLQKTIDTIGVTERRVSPESICTSDLCFAAAEKLFDETLIDKSEIDAIIFISQTPDYRLPATACILQNRLGLAKSAIAFDVNLGCSGYVYGLSIASAFANIANFRKVLLLVGDTPTKFTSNRDKSSALLFGDAGSATIIENTNNDKDSFYNLFTDGEGSNSLIINGGGYRNISNCNSFNLTEDEDGNIRNSEQLYMNGAEIFNFTLKEVPKGINELLEANKIEISEIDHFIFHQANKFMIDFLRRKIKIPVDKFLFSLNKFGNTSSASIPLTLVLNKNEHFYNKVLLSGFGVGLSWANCCLDISNTKIIDLIEI